MVEGETWVVVLFPVVETLSNASAEPAALPLSAIFASPPEVFITVSVAERSPTADGVLLTAMVQSRVLSALRVQAGEAALKSGAALSKADDAVVAAP